MGRSSLSLPLRILVLPLLINRVLKSARQRLHGRRGPLPHRNPCPETPGEDARQRADAFRPAGLGELAPGSSLILRRRPTRSCRTEKAGDGVRLRPSTRLRGCSDRSRE